MLTRVRALMIGGCLILTAWLVSGCGGSTGTASTGAGSTHAGSTSTAVKTTTTSASAAASFANQTSATVISDGATAMAAARSFTAAGVIDINHAPDDTTLAVRAPSSVAMSIRESAGVVLKITLIGKQSWLWADAGFWQKQEGGKLTPAEVDEVSDRWYVVPASETDKLAGTISQVSPSQLAFCLREAMVRPTVVGQRTVDGQSAVEVHTDGGAPGQSPGNLWIATAAPHYPIRFQQTGRPEPGGSGACASSPTEGDGTGDLTFSGWNRTAVSAPANATDLP